MKINDIHRYIWDGYLEDYNMKVEIPEQEKGAIAITMDRKTTFPGHYINRLLGVKGDPDGIEKLSYPGERWIGYIKHVHEHLPYHLTDIHGRGWRIDRRCRLVPPRDLDIPWKDGVIGTFSVINMEESLKDIIMYNQPSPPQRRHEKKLGQAYRLNKLLLNNGFPPVEFPWITEKQDVLNMLFLDEFTLSEIYRNYYKPGRMFVRGDRKYVLGNKGMIDAETGKRTVAELGWRLDV